MKLVKTLAFIASGGFLMQLASCAGLGYSGYGGVNLLPNFNIISINGILKMLGLIQ